MSTNDVPNNGDQPTPEGDEGDVQPISEEGIEDEALLAKIRKQNSELKNMRQRMREGFGPERERLTQRIKELEPLASKAKEIEEAQKTEEQRMADRLSEAERKAQEATAAALRLEVALDVAPEGMSLSQIRKLAKRLTGDDRGPGGRRGRAFRRFRSPGGRVHPHPAPTSAGVSAFGGCTGRTVRCVQSVGADAPRQAWHPVRVPNL